MKIFLVLGAALAIAAATNKPPHTSEIKNETVSSISQLAVPVSKPYSGTSVSDVVTEALEFKALLTTAQQTTLEKTYTTTLARKWSNLPCGSGCRNGIQFSALTAAQLTAALEVIQAAAGTNTNEGYDEFLQVRAAEEVLQATAGGTNYDEGNYWISFLNTPSTTGAWMLQYGGHHYAANIAFNGGNVVGTTPVMEGVEPVSWTTSGTTYAPLTTEHDAMANMLASFTTAQLTTAKLSGTFSDVLMSPGESNGNSNTFPATKVGIQGSALTATQKNLVLTAIQAWLNDVDATSAATLLASYSADIDNIYIGWTGSGTSGNASSFLNANTNYVRIDGTRVWIEFVCQSGVVFPAQIHYHSVWRDHTHDYGADLTNTALPLHLLNFNVTNNDDQRLLFWQTADETNVSKYIVQRGVDGNTYSDINTVAAKNAASNTYTINDNELLSEKVIYYRLKMIDRDGSYSFSKVVSIKNNNDNLVSIFPNPTVTSLQVVLKTAINNGSIRIISGDGKTVISKNNVTGQRLSFDVSGLVKGSYIIVVAEDKTVWKGKFIK